MEMEKKTSVKRFRSTGMPCPNVAWSVFLRTAADPDSSDEEIPLASNQKAAVPPACPDKFFFPTKAILFLRKVVYAAPGQKNAVMAERW